RPPRRARWTGWPGRARSRLRRAQLRTKVLAGVLAVTVIALVAFDFAAVSVFRGYLLGQTDGQLRSVLNVYRVASAMSPAPPGGESVRPGPGHQQPARQRVRAAPRFKLAPRPNLRSSLLQPFSVTLLSGRTVRAVSPKVTVKGVAIGGGLPAVPGDVTAAASRHGWWQGWTVTGGSGDLVRMLAGPYPGGRILIATTSLAGVSRAVGRLELIVIIGSVVAGLVVAVGIGWLVRRGLRPIATMAAQADRITAGDLTDRVSEADPQTEVGRLGAALNGMLTRIEVSVAEREAGQEATRRFFADASHELRTPLASLRANAELYQQGALAGKPQVDEAMRRIALEAQRMSGLVDDMLRLARLDQYPGQRYEPVDVTAVVAGCAERARAADPQREFRTRIASGLATTGDEELLRRAVDNLLANVHAHTPGGTAATVTAGRQDGRVVVEVSDDGPGVPADRLPRIFDRFYRAAAPSGRPGSGLGLAIVAAAAIAHDGTVTAALNHPHGLRVRLALP
ncbi:MAG: HAMP domain-containing histidine kinase, partial [Actinobacteria bacterium]|nr:HAMP domain-containing histidine kinase [Actinomycetota bacterium]